MHGTDIPQKVSKPVRFYKFADGRSVQGIRYFRFVVEGTNFFRIKVDNMPTSRFNQGGLWDR